MRHLILVFVPLSQRCRSKILKNKFHYRQYGNQASFSANSKVDGLMGGAKERKDLSSKDAYINEPMFVPDRSKLNPDNKGFNRNL